MLFSMYFRCPSPAPPSLSISQFYIKCITSLTRSSKIGSADKLKKAGLKIMDTSSTSLYLLTCTDDCLILNFNFPISIMKALLIWAPVIKLFPSPPKTYNIEDRQFHQIFHQNLVLFLCIPFSHSHFHSPSLRWTFLLFTLSATISASSANVSFEIRLLFYIHPIFSEV